MRLLHGLQNLWLEGHHQVVLQLNLVFPNAHLLSNVIGGFVWKQRNKSYRKLFKIPYIYYPLVRELVKVTGIWQVLDDVRSA